MELGNRRGSAVTKILFRLLVAEPLRLHGRRTRIAPDSLVIPIEYKYLTKHVLDSLLVPNDALRRSRECARIPEIRHATDSGNAPCYSDGYAFWPWS